MDPSYASVISPALFNYFVSVFPVCNKSYAPNIVEPGARANQIITLLDGWVNWKQLAIAPQMSSVALFTSNSHQSSLKSCSAYKYELATRWLYRKCALICWALQGTPTLILVLMTAALSSGHQGLSKRHVCHDLVEMGIFNRDCFGLEMHRYQKRGRYWYSYILEGR